MLFDTQVQGGAYDLDSPRPLVRRLRRRRQPSGLSPGSVSGRWRGSQSFSSAPALQNYYKKNTPSSGVF